MITTTNLSAKTGQPHGVAERRLVRRVFLLVVAAWEGRRGSRFSSCVPRRGGFHGGWMPVCSAVGAGLSCPSWPRVVGAVGRLTDAEVAAFVESSCRAQGVPVKVRDARVLRDVVALLGVRAVRPGPRAKRDRADGPARSEAPGDLHPVRVEDAGAGSGEDPLRRARRHLLIGQPATAAAGEGDRRQGAR